VNGYKTEPGVHLWLAIEVSVRTASLYREVNAWVAEHPPASASGRSVGACG